MHAAQFPDVMGGGAVADDVGTPGPAHSVNLTTVGTLYYDALGRQIGSRDAMG